MANSAAAKPAPTTNHFINELWTGITLILVHHIRQVGDHTVTTLPGLGSSPAQFVGHAAFGLGELRGDMERFVLVARAATASSASAHD